MIKLYDDIDEEDYSVINGITIIADRYSGTWSGSKAELMEYEIDEDDWFYGFMHYVFCPKCGVRTETDWSKKEVMRKWNNRELE